MRRAAALLERGSILSLDQPTLHDSGLHDVIFLSYFQERGIDSIVFEILGGELEHFLAHDQLERPFRVKAEVTDELETVRIEETIYLLKLPWRAGGGIRVHLSVGLRFRGAGSGIEISEQVCVGGLDAEGPLDFIQLVDFHHIWARLPPGAENLVLYDCRQGNRFNAFLYLIIDFHLLLEPPDFWIRFAFCPEWGDAQIKN